MAELARNGFQHKLMQNGMKNLGVKFLYRVKFHKLTYDNGYYESQVLADKFNDHANNDAKTNNGDTLTKNPIDFIYFSRGVSGLPEFGVEPIKDNFFIYTQKVPGRPKNDFPDVNIDFIIKETGEPVVNFLSELNKMTRLQGNDFYARNGSGDVLQSSVTNEDAAIEPIIQSQYLAANFARNQTKRIFFEMSISALEYGSYKPWMTYKFNNCWLSGVKINDSFKETDNSLMQGQLKITYDFPEILFYDNNGNATTDSTLPTANQNTEA